MDNEQKELEFEKLMLEQTVALAKSQLNQAIQGNENNKQAIIEAKQEMRDNTSHSISGLWSSEGFEALAELSQYVNPVMNKIAEFEATSNRIAALEKLTDNPYFARIDFKFDDEDEFEKIYIGRSSLKKDNSYEMVVYDWRSPIASVFYRFVTGNAFYEAPDGKITGKLSLKRQYEISKGELEYFFDADVQIIDEFLRKLLSQNTSSKMKSIVETIQKEQDIVIRDMENDLMMVQGVAGSGKTSVALHRAAYLMYQGLSSKLSAGSILVISPNTLFEQYISNVLPELGEDNVQATVFDEMLKKILRNERIQAKNRFLEQLITSSESDIIKSSMEFKTSPVFLEILNRFIDDLPRRWIDFDDVFFGDTRIISKEKLKDRILTGRKDTPLGLKLRQLEEFILELIYELNKSRANSTAVVALRAEIQKFTRLDIESLYVKLFEGKQYFYGLAEGLRLPDCIDEILAFTWDNLQSQYLSYDDATVIAYLNVKINKINRYKNIEHVVIDEAQDYYPLHFEIFNLLFTKAKYTILGDINQTLEKQVDLSLYEQIAGILNKKKSALVTMDKSFRCTNEILNYSSKFIKQSTEIKSFNRTGGEPAVFTAADRQSLADMIIKETNICLEKGYRSIGLICKTERNAHSLFERIKNKIDVQLITSKSKADLLGIFVIPVYMSKGLEFDAVLICDCDNENYSSADDGKLLYIACTRALHRLNLFCAGEASRLL